MFSIGRIITPNIEYIWAEVTLPKETTKAILVTFDGRKRWLPRSWIRRIKQTKRTGIISIKIEIHRWCSKF